jgi:hypothetical protein
VVVSVGFVERVVLFVNGCIVLMVRFIVGGLRETADPMRDTSAKAAISRRNDRVT